MRMKLFFSVLSVLIVTALWSGISVWGDPPPKPATAADVPKTKDLPKNPPPPATKPAPPAVKAEPVSKTAADEAAITKAATQFVDDYNKHDAAALAKQFTSNAEIIDDAGTLTSGVEAIKKSYAELFAKHPNCSLEVEIQSIRVLTPHLAVEEGTAHIGDDEGHLQSNEYVAIHHKEGADWKIVSVRDFPPHNNQLTATDHLQDLAWMLGDWTDEGHDATVKSRCTWADSDKFLVQIFEVVSNGEVVMTGSMRIGWDPVAQQFRSWMFDSNGSFFEGLWSRNGDTWLVKSQGVTSTGQAASSSMIYTLQDEDTLVQSMFEQVIGGVAVSPSPDVTIKRHPPAPGE